MTTQAGTSLATAPLYPPRIEGPARPLGFLRTLTTFVDNPLRALPQPAYEEPFVVFRPATGSRCIVWVTAPAIVEQVLLVEADSFRKTAVERRVFSRSVGDSVLTSDGALWRWQRRVLAPLFRHADLLTYVPAMSAAGATLLGRWRSRPGRQVRDVEPDMSETTFDVILATMLSDGRPAEARTLLDSGARYLRPISWEVAWGVLRIPEWLPHPASWRLDRAAADMRAAVAAMVARRRNGEGDPSDLLGRLLAARDPETGEGMSDPQILNNLLTLLMAGHETTAKALTWTLYLLARAPDWQERVREEARSIAGEDAIGAAHVDRLAVTEMVLKEALRLYPPAPVMAREPVRGFKLTDQWIPAGSQVVIPIWCIHRHRRLWSDPDRFDPERFSPERMKSIGRTQFMPFGAGARICLGASFAMLEAKTLLATLVRGARFEWDGRHAPEPVSRVTLRPRGGMPLIVTPIQPTR